MLNLIAIAIVKDMHYVAIHTCKQLEKDIGDYFEITFPMSNELFKGYIWEVLKTKIVCFMI